MASKTVMGGGAIIIGILIAATQALDVLPGELHYLWALLVIIWGIMAMK